MLQASDLCWLCGHPGADQVDHVVPRSMDTRRDVADPTNLRPAHGVNGCPTCGVKCNQARGNGTRLTHVVRSRDW